MKNVKAKMNGAILTLEIDTSVRLGASSTGKSETVASTSGNVDAGSIEGLPPGIKVGLNVFCKK
jgi:hypothetical protein